MRTSKYWDNFQERADETVSCVLADIPIPVRRVAIFVTNKCQMRCQYCNHRNNGEEMTQECFVEIIKIYGDGVIYHITGGEPSTVKWLYPFLREHGRKYQFHLNTNALVSPPAESILRLKVSLDSCNAEYWNALVGLNAFDSVVRNIQAAIPKTITSITFTMTRENYKTIPDFIEFYRSNFAGAYAVFFSTYKGKNERFSFRSEDVNNFFSEIKPIMDATLDEESKALFNETIDEKFRIMQGNRFPENELNKCYLSLSERVYSPNGSMSGCSHLVRDGIQNEPGQKHDKCKYGCNRRLVAFNREIEDRVKTPLNKEMVGNV